MHLPSRAREVFALMLFILAAAIAPLRATAQTVPFPPAPTVKMAVNPVTNKVYTLNESANTVSVLDATTGATKTIAVVTTRVDIDDAGHGLDDIRDERQLDAWLAAHCTDYVHAVGTCRMGAADDPAAVVDPDGRVIGMEGLRVVDASIMPEVPRANTHLTTVMIAEHIAVRIQSL